MSTLATFASRRREPATFWTRCKSSLQVTWSDRGWFVSPTVFADVDNSSTIAHEEIFGLVLVRHPLVRHPLTDIDDPVRIANDSGYGLGGSVWTSDPERGKDIGPIVRGSLTEEHRAALADSYRACLNPAAQMPSVRSIALCSVSTGVFGFPPQPATDIVVSAVVSWLSEHPAALDRSVFNGLSAAAGFEYGDTVDFARHFPDLTARGIRAHYEMIVRDLPDEVPWGYWFPHVFQIRFGAPPVPVYSELRQLIGDRDHWVWTSNVDGLFERSGFIPSQIYIPQGAYAFYQCITQTWPSTPRCANCGGTVFLNVHAGRWYLPDRYAPTGRALIEWLQRGAGSLPHTGRRPPPDGIHRRRPARHHPDPY